MKNYREENAAEIPGYAFDKELMQIEDLSWRRHILS